MSGATLSDDAQTPAEEPVEDLLNFLADLIGTGKVHVDVLPALLREAADKIERLRKEAHEERQMSTTFEALLREATDEIERLQEEINDLRLQVVTLSIPKETRHG